MMNPDNQAIPPEDVDNYAHQVAALMVAATVHVGSIHYIAQMFARAENDGVLPGFVTRLNHHLVEALKPQASGLLKIQEMSGFLTTHVLEIERIIADAFKNNPLKDQDMRTLDELQETRRIYKGAADDLFKAVSRVVSNSVNNWKQHKMQLGVAEHLRKHMGGSCQDEEPEDDIIH